MRTTWRRDAIDAQTSLLHFRYKIHRSGERETYLFERAGSAFLELVGMNDKGPEARRRIANQFGGNIEIGKWVKIG